MLRNSHLVLFACYRCNIIYAYFAQVTEGIFLRSCSVVVLQNLCCGSEFSRIRSTGVVTGALIIMVQKRRNEDEIISRYGRQKV